MVSFFTFTVVAVLILLYVIRQSKMFKKIIFSVNNALIFILGIVADNMNRKKNCLEELPSRKGEVAVVTGGARGIGLHVVKVLAKCGMHVVLGVRDVDTARKVIDDLDKTDISGTFAFFQLDLSSCKSVKSFWKSVNKEYPKVHLLVNNAGILYGDFVLTEDGFERQLATNYIGHFYLTHLLMNNLKSAGDASGKCARIVNVSSCMHYAADIDFDDIHMKKSYEPVYGYARSKLAQLMFTKFFNRQLESEGLPVRCYANHPGLVATDMFYNSPGADSVPWLAKIMKKPEEGATPVLHCCLSSKLENKGGAYISNGEEGYSTSFSKNVEHQKRLFDMTCRMLNISKFGVLEPDN